MRVGSFEVVPLIDGAGTDDAETLRRPGHQDPWCGHEDQLVDGAIPLTFGGFHVRTVSRVMVVDLGVGPGDSGRFTGGGLLPALRANGVAPQDVTDVLLTHLHFDHIGWASRDGIPWFPRADYRLHLADWRRFVEDPVTRHPIAVEKLQPIADRVVPFDAETRIAAGVTARPLPGHTPGSTAYEFESDGDRLLLLGDIAHSTVEIAEEGWESRFDVDADAARASRARALADLADTPTTAALAHLRDLQFGYVRRAARGYAWHRRDDRAAAWAGGACSSFDGERRR